MQIGQARIGDSLHFQKYPEKFGISTIYNFAVIYP